MNVQSILKAKGSDVATIGQRASLSEAAAQLRDHGVGALVVSDDGQHIDGIVSERDVVRALAAHGASALGRTVHSVMSATVVTCTAGDSVEQLMVSMTERRFRHIPVVDGDVLAGIISIGDVVKARLGQLETENQALDGVHPPGQVSATSGRARYRLGRRAARSLPSPRCRDRWGRTIAGCSPPRRSPTSETASASSPTPGWRRRSPATRCSSP